MSEPSPTERPARTHEHPAGERAPVERYGPLTLERTRKEDGRALIYFSVSAPQ